MDLTIPLDVSSPTHVDSAVGLDADQVVNSVSKALFTAKILLSRLDGHVAQQELNLVQLPSGIAAQAGTSPSKVVRGEFINSCLFGAVLHDVLHDPLRHTIAPGLACPADAPENPAFAYASGRKPRVNRAFNPIWNGHCPNMAGLADHINDGPVVLPPLKVRDIQFRRFFPAQPASQEDSKQSSISFALERVRVGHMPERSCLVGGEPIAKANAEVLRAFHTADASSEIRTEQTGVRGLVCEAPDGRKPATDRVRRRLA